MNCVENRSPPPSPQIYCMTLFRFDILRQNYDQELSFHRKFHQNKHNKYIHAICIPLEWISWYIFFAIIHMRLNYAVGICLACYYCILKISTPSLFGALFHILVPHFCNSMCAMCDRMWQPIVSAVIVQILAWYFQVYVGHIMYEKNKPALTSRLTVNSILVSLLLAWDDS